MQKNIDGIIFDSLTPFFAAQGFKDFEDNKKGGAFIEKIEDLLRKENLDNVMILFGGRGSGKSTFFKRLIRHLKPRVIENSINSFVDLIDSAQIADELSKEIWQKVLIGMDKNKLLHGSKEELIKLFADRYALYEKQILSGITQDSIEYQKLLNDFIKESLKDIKYCSERISKFWKSKNKGLIIIIDNMDQLPPDLQDVSFLNAIEVAKKLSCLVIISMREERYYNAKSKGVLDAYATPGFHITSPVIPEVISRRIDYTLHKFSAKTDLRKEIGLINNETYQTLKKFLIICYKEVRRKDSDLSKFLRYSTHGDVRQGLEFFNGFIQSGYLNISEMTLGDGWTFQTHQVIKPMMIPNRFFYDEKNSRMPNLYQLRNDVNSSHFCGLRILHLLNNKNFDKLTAGFYDIKFLIQKFESDYDLKNDCINNLNTFLAKGIIEASNRLEEYSENVDQVKITSFGKYILDYLAFDFTYLDLISLECGLFDEALANFMITSANKEVQLYHEKHLYERVTYRLNRVDKFIEYLEKQEQKEFEDLALGDNENRFTKKLRDHFDIQKKQVLKSAKKNASYDFQNPEIFLDEN